ncbi:hypothetical protein PNEG_02330 [Pneumocystis murina B123]|uniref:SAM-dependent MTase RsmB/NOP-type domain-containing protein n=1 Tax=Pneumocystis murina (strain B123) TaxID=1069680 RepID=M7NL47_PNEMU|nr:hypothetical protein PNEG_02330 [Pneumocystis murina B123]EMR09383.1 hypothetical protein PNEG_02330 [Pneumocystis murina B123]
MVKKRNCSKKHKDGKNGFIENYNSIIMKNEKMENYYRQQGIVEDDDWEMFMESIKQSLPTTFRITGSKKNAQCIKKHLEDEYFPLFKGLKYEGKEIEPPSLISWYPNQLVYSLNTPKTVIRKNKAFKKFQDWLFYETESGNITRQEVVSMIPPLLLDVEPYHSIIDLCAAPGSKTAQFLEAIHNKLSETDTCEIYPKGFLIANDVDSKRAYMLVHQIKRFNSPCMIVTNHDASKLPNFYVDDGIDNDLDPSKTARRYILKFDRVLADVPCTGDGAIRKNLNIWKDWDIRQAFGLHTTQVNILIRGLQLLKVNGRLVYSTCSLNPIENEAVVSAVLRIYGNSIRLVDVSDRLLELKRKNGMNTWKVIDSNGEILAFDDRFSLDQKKMPRSLWPPSEEEIDKFCLDRCLRIYPHLQNTGGFFVAVFEKIEKLNDMSRKHHEEGLRKQYKRDLDDSGTDITLENDLSKKVKKDTSFINETLQFENSLGNKDLQNNTIANFLNSSEVQNKDSKTLKNCEYFKFLSEDCEEIKNIKAFYNISNSFPSTQYVVRNINAVPTRFIYFLSKKIKNILYHNEDRIKFVHGGVKMFTKHEFLKNSFPENICRWRIQNEGVRLLFPFLGPERVIYASFNELKIFLNHDYPKIDMFPEGKVKTSLEKISLGCIIMVVDLENEESVKVKLNVILPIWKSNVSANLMLSKKDKTVLMMRVYGSSYHFKDHLKDDLLLNASNNIEA